MDWLKEVTKYHQEWIRVMKSFGAKDQAEDFVQEVYMRLIERSNKKKLFKNNRLNKSYVYFALRNTWIMHIRKHRKNSEKNNIQFLYIEDLKREKRNTYFYEQLMVKKKNNQDPKVKHIKWEMIQEKLNKEIFSWHWYDIMLFFMYINSEKSIRQMSSESGIHKDNINRTLLKCKKRIKNAIAEDYEDFQNKDYDKILNEHITPLLWSKIMNI
jgi:RNA polymerase sigma factor (sigma-70 family)